MTTQRTAVAACIDITGSKRAMDVVVLRDDGKVEHFAAKNSGILMEILKSNKPRILAIDGPSGENKGRTREKQVREQFGWTDKFSDKLEPDGSAMPLYGNMRLCEALLIVRGIGAYSTLPDTTRVAKWIQRGWWLYKELGKLGYALWGNPGPVVIGSQLTAIEVHPHASFVVGLGWIPAPKDSIRGQLERIAYLLDALKWNQRSLCGTCLPSRTMLHDLCRCIQEATWESIRTEGIRIRSLTHDVIDCLGGLASALSCLAGTAYAIGDSEEGVIVLPREPITSTYRKPVEE